MNDGSPTSWWQHALLDPALPARAGIIIACAVGAIFLFALLRRLHPRTPKPGYSRPRGLHNTDGTVTLELALIMPFLLFLILILAQTTFLMAGNLVVHYAAFAATRSAIVQIPRYASDDEPPNVIVPEPGMVKFDNIRAAAVFAVTPVCGEIASGTIDTQTIVETLTAHYENNNRAIPNWLTRLVAGRIRYADHNTDVRILRTVLLGDNTVRFDDLQLNSQGQVGFGPRETVTVSISHYFHLGVPVIWTLYADDDADRVTRIEAQYSLTNEGVEEAMPPDPAANGYPRQNGL